MSLESDDKPLPVPTDSSTPGALDDEIPVTVQSRPSLEAVLTGDPPTDAAADRPSRRERVRPKLTLRIPDDEIVRPDQVKREPITQPDLVDQVAGGRPSSVPPPAPAPTPLDDIPTATGSLLLIEPDPSSPLLPLIEPEAPRFEVLREGPFADDATEDSWTPWQPTALETREAEEARAALPAVAATVLPSVALKAPVTTAADLAEDAEAIPLEPDEEEEWHVPSNPPEVAPEDLLLVEPATASMAPPPVAPRAPPVLVPPPATSPAVPSPPAAPAPTPTVLQAPAAAPLPAAFGMESMPPEALSPSGAPPPVTPAVLSAPKLHQVLAEGGPRLGATATIPAATPPSEPRFADGKKRVKPWWEELFNDDYLRTVGTIKDAEIAAEATFIEESLGVARGATVLDLACGTGRHAIELAKRGYQVIGFDLSLAMLARASDEAQERNQKLNFVQGDMREMTFEDAFDGVYCWQTSFGFFEEEKNAAVVGKVHKALKKGGQFLLDVLNRDQIARNTPSLVWFEGDGCICMDEVHLDFITSRLRVKRTMMMDDGRSKEIEYSIRVYSLHELGKLLNDAGFRVAEVTGRIQTPGVFFGGESPSIIILAEKR